MAMRRGGLPGIFSLTLLLITGLTHASPTQVTVHTPSLLLGTSAALAFDLNNGGPPPNSLTISGFATDGILGAASLAVDLGTPTSVPNLNQTVTFSDVGLILTEYLQYITLGTSLSFTFDTTGLPPSPPGIVPDAFSFFLLDGDTLLPLVTTSDPTGADALLLYNIGVANPLAVYTSIVMTVPEPDALALFSAGLLAAGAMRRPKRRGRIGQFPKGR